jgi:hypothetical protein
MAIPTFPPVRLSAMVAAVGLAATTLLHAPAPGIAQAQLAQQKAGKAEVKTPMDRCMDTWDRAAQMSKEEWRATCKRTIKENPGLYNKSF